MNDTRPTRSALNFLSSLAESASTIDLLHKAALGSAILPIPAVANDSMNAESPEEDEFCSNFLKHLPKPLLSYAQTLVTAAPSSSSVAELTEEESIHFAIAQVDSYEVSVKKHLQSLTQNLLTSNTRKDAASVEEALEELLQFGRGVIDLALHVCHYSNKYQKQLNFRINSPQFQKIPFLVLEDLVDTLPISLLQIIWSQPYGPSMWLTDLLCPTDLFTKNQGSKYVLIRLCNRLLSKAGSGECMLLDSNESSSSSGGGGSTMSGFGFAGNVNRLLARVFPLSERSAVNVLGNFHVDRTIAFESEEDFRIQQQRGDMESGSTKGSAGTTVGNYDLYQTFWSVQNSFTAPAKLLPKPLTLAEKRALSSGAAAPTLYDASDMEKFLKQMEVVLDAFQSHSFDNELKLQLEARVQDETDRGTEDVINGAETQTNDAGESMEIDEMPAKFTAPSATKKTSNSKRYYQYLTSSQLLPLQLQDPELRIQFITQFFLIASYIKSSIQAYSTTPTASLSHANRDKCKSVLFNLKLLLKRAGETMEAIPPNGKEHKMALEWTLNEREIIWKEWKKQKCTPPIEKIQSIDSSSSKEEESRTLTARKVTSIRKTKSDRYTTEINISEELPILSQTLARANAPNIYDYFQEYVEALDPEAGIEAEYHPKNNVLFCWRAMRLLAKDNVGRFPDEESEVKNDDEKSTEEAVISSCMVKKSNGDFEGMVRTIWKEEKNKDIPGEMPSTEDTSHDLVVEEVEAEVAQEEQDKDETMEETEAKEEADANEEAKAIAESESSEETNKEESKDKDNSNVDKDAKTENLKMLPSKESQMEEKVGTKADRKDIKESNQESEPKKGSDPGEASTSETNKHRINKSGEKAAPSSSDSSDIIKEGAQSIGETDTEKCSKNDDDSKARGEEKSEAEVKELKPMVSQGSKEKEDLNVKSLKEKDDSEDRELKVEENKQPEKQLEPVSKQNKKRKADDMKGVEQDRASKQSKQTQNGSSTRDRGDKRHDRKSEETADKNIKEDSVKVTENKQNDKKHTRRGRDRHERNRSREKDKNHKNEITVDEKKGSNTSEKRDDGTRKLDNRDGGFRRDNNHHGNRRREDRNKENGRRDKGNDEYYRGAQRGGTNNNTTQQQPQQDTIGQNQGRMRQNGGGQGRRGSSFAAPVRGREKSPPPPPPPQNQQRQGRDGGGNGGRRNDGRSQGQNNGPGNDHHQNKRNWGDGGGGRDRHHRGRERRRKY